MKKLVVLIGLALLLVMVIMASCGSTPVTKVSEIDGMVLVYIPEGEFEMGSEDGKSNESPVHRVFLDAFWIDQTEVTNEMFSIFVDGTGYETFAEDAGWSYVYQSESWDVVSSADWVHPQGPDSSIQGIEDHPVVNVSWDDASAYCEWTERRLPTEAEWEKAARGTDGAAYPWGNGDVSGNLLNFADSNLDVKGADNSVDDGYQFTAPTGNYPQGASPYGVFDMAGNVWEWLADWYESDYYSSSPGSNPTGPSSGGSRVLRGGSFRNFDKDVRSAFRHEYPPASSDYSLGFRCAVSP